MPQTDGGSPRFPCGAASRRRERSSRIQAIRLVTMMVETQQRHLDIAINFTPCGVEVQRFWPDTCDKVLDGMFPLGYTLTVYGDHTAE